VNPGERVGAYVLESLLGKGGFGQVWKARDEKLQRSVALKLLTDYEPEDLRRFVREAQTAASLNHPGIAAIYEVGERHIAMQLIDGGTLKPGPDSVRQVRDAARAVGYAHQKGVVHRDLKPANIMVERATVERATGNGQRVFVLDFGLARQLRADSSLTMSGMVIGTPAYMPPEQARGERATPASDVWSLGATLYEVLAGSRPFTADSVTDLFMRVLTEEPAPIPGLPRDLATILGKCLHKDPRRRYPDAGALADDLTCFLDRRPISARPPGPLARLARRIAARPVLSAVLGAGSLAVAAATLLLLPRLAVSQEEVARRERMQRLEDAVAHTRPYFYIRDVDIVARLRAVRDALVELDAVEPKDDAIWTLLGLAHHFLGDNAAAEGALLRSRDPRARACLGRIHVERAMTERLTFGKAAIGGRAHSARALAHLTGPAGAADMDARVAAIYVAVLREDAKLAGRLCLEGVAELGDRPGAEEIWTLMGMADPDVEEKLRHYDRALAIRPHFPWALFCRAIQRRASGDAAGARADIDTAIRIFPNWAIALSNRGHLRREANDLDGAAQDYEAALRADPAFAPAHANYSHIHLERGDFDRAVASAGRALEIDPRSAVALTNRGMARMELGDLDRALADFDEALRIEPDTGLFHFNRAICLHKRGRTAEAADAYGEAIRFDGTLWEAHFHRGTILAAGGRHAEAASGFAAVLALKPGHVPSLIRRACAFTAMGDFAAAVREADELVRASPSPHSYLFRADARAKAGDGDGALTDYADSIARDPAYADAYNSRGILRRARRDSDGAMADYNEALRVRPDHVGALVNRADLREARGDRAGAEADFARALELAPADWPHRAAVEKRLRTLRSPR